MKVIEAGLPGVKFIEPTACTDHRGYLMETYQAGRYREHGILAHFVQDNISWSKKGVLRGLHFQHPYGQGKLLTVLEGTIFDIVVDMRYSSATFGKSFSVMLDSKKCQQLWIPAGFAHGFQVASEAALVLYKCDAYYNPKTEKILAWNDPDLCIDWPIKSPQLSSKDSSGRRLCSFELSELPS